MLRRIFGHLKRQPLRIREVPYRVWANHPRRFPVQVVAAGDSHTFERGWHITIEEFYPSLLAASLRDMGIPAGSRNWGNPGYTSRQIRQSIERRTIAPTIAIVWAGSNDPLNGIPEGDTIANIVASGRAFIERGCRFLVVVNTHYLNYVNGGDSLDVEWPAYRSVRQCQREAAGILAIEHPGRVAYCDTYAYFRGLITSGQEVERSASWHILPNNQHLNQRGQRYIAEAILVTILTQDGWLDALAGD